MMRASQTHSWIQSYGGRAIDPFNLTESDVEIEDISHALANLCRFGGHSRHFYSVAQHCTIVSQIVPARLSLAGLLHDADEAYVVDLPAPLKVRFPEYRELCDKVQRVINRRFGITLTDDDRRIIKDADNTALATEARDLLQGGPLGNWHEKYGMPLHTRVLPQAPTAAKAVFMMRYRLLTSNLRVLGDTQ